MPIKLPRIEGTAYDAALNEFIDSVNGSIDSDQPKLAAHAAAAISRFLVENHEVETGTRWIEKALPLVEHLAIIAPMVDKLYQPLVERAKQPQRAGCMGVAAVLVAASGLAGLALWWFGRSR